MRRPRHDPKPKALQEQGALNNRADTVTDPLFAQSDFFDARDLVQVKYEMVRRVEVDGHAVSAAARAFGFSRPSFYQTQAALRAAGMVGLLPKKRGPKTARKLDADIVSFVQQARSIEDISTPELVSRVQERFGVKVHRRSIERALARQKKKHP